MLWWRSILLASIAAAVTSSTLNTIAEMLLVRRPMISFIPPRNRVLCGVPRCTNILVQGLKTRRAIQGPESTTGGLNAQQGLSGGELPFHVLHEADYPLHSRATSWVVFSDLHCSTQTVDVCRTVLRTVHETALQHDAGIIFLGDFWHLRGALRIEVLNGVLRELEKWTVPVIMLPGNHDQVTLDGSVHGLTPLAYAMRGSGPTEPPQGLVLSSPTLFLDALWLPYSRDTRPIKEAFQSIEQHREGGPTAPFPSPSVLFCHADVRGASMNDNIISRRGLRASLFPRDLPTYSGHFHKPHVVPNTSITYIGSPYQVSLSEAGQAKRFLLLSRSKTNDQTKGGRTWAEKSSVPVDVGRRYFRVGSTADAGAILAAEQLRTGDRVVLSTGAAPLGPDVEALRQTLTKAGVECEVREGGDVSPSGGLDLGASSNVTGLPDYEAMGPAEVFRTYMSEALSFTADDTRQRRLMELGVSLISEGRSGANATTVRRGGHGPVRLELERVRLQGYGPFREPVDYPLGGRGMVLIRGRNMDDPAAESNAAGKSKLAMSVHWALTGQVDERPVMDGRVGDVAFDVTAASDILGPASDIVGMEEEGEGGRKKRKARAKKTDQGTEDRAAFAEVAVQGKANGLAFEVVRRRGSRVNDLTFHLDGKDMTRQGVRETQAVMEETLGISADFLATSVFCGQHQMNGLLEATDVRFKERLGQVVEVGQWGELTDRAKALAKSHDTTAAQLRYQAALTQRDLDGKAADRAALQASLATAKADLSQATKAGPTVDISRLEGELEAAMQRMETARVAWEAQVRESRQGSQAIQQAKARVSLLQSRVKDKEAKLHKAVVRLFGKDTGGQWDVRAMEAEKAKIDDEVDSARGAHRLSVDGLARAEARVEGLSASLEGLQHTHSEGEEEGCPTCGREWGDEAAREERRRVLKTELKSAKQAVTAGRKQLKLMAKALEGAQARQADLVALMQQGLELEQEQKELQVALEKAGEGGKGGEDAGEGTETTAEEREYNEAKAAHQRLQASYPAAIKSAGALQELEGRVARLKKDRDRLSKDVKALEKTLHGLTQQAEEVGGQGELYRELVEHLGVRGVQAFVYRGALSQLERLANHFLSLLADASLRLQLSLDGDRVHKSVSVRGASGAYIPGTLSKLSGGQYRRASLACVFAFRELSRLRARVDVNVLVLDEVLNHLDGPGRIRVGRALRALLQQHRGAADDAEGEEEQAGSGNAGLDTIIVILQDLAAYELQDSFDRIDEVWKERDQSTVIVDGALDSREMGKGDL